MYKIGKYHERLCWLFSYSNSKTIKIEHIWKRMPEKKNIYIYISCYINTPTHVKCEGGPLPCPYSIYFTDVTLAPFQKPHTSPPPLLSLTVLPPSLSMPQSLPLSRQHSFFIFIHFSFRVICLYTQSLSRTHTISLPSNGQLASSLLVDWK